MCFVSFVFAEDYRTFIAPFHLIWFDILLELNKSIFKKFTEWFEGFAGNAGTNENRTKILSGRCCCRHVLILKTEAKIIKERKFAVEDAKVRMNIERAGKRSPR